MSFEKCATQIFKSPVVPMWPLHTFRKEGGQVNFHLCSFFHSWTQKFNQFYRLVVSRSSPNCEEVGIEKLGQKYGMINSKADSAGHKTVPWRGLWKEFEQRLCLPETKNPLLVQLHGEFGSMHILPCYALFLEKGCYQPRIPNKNRRISS